MHCIKVPTILNTICKVETSKIHIKQNIDCRPNTPIIINLAAVNNLLIKYIGVQSKNNIYDKKKAIYINIIYYQNRTCYEHYQQSVHICLQHIIARNLAER